MPGTVEHDDRLTAALRERGLRVTSQRILINRVLHELYEHVTAEEVLDAVADRLPGVSLPTVYATLDLLEELGEIRRVAIPGGPALFDRRTSPHHHMVCRACGRAEDIDAEVDLGGALRSARRRGFSSRDAQVLVTGMCEECTAEAATEAPRAARRPRS
ncbi:MAG: Fur family transcriptional regulator, stress-responsive regulator [Solirubrobacteraceae bacterium]|nr:Fur family transcriptional regulator, stress-responsive regulator [Solirubrobacteraceae bacterium]